MSALAQAADFVAKVARPITAESDYDALLRLAGDQRLVLIDEVSHGTHEFYEVRA
jgi:erythromycin esterase-like protein